MTSTLTIRLPVATKAALQRHAQPSVNAWLNRVIERALAESDAGSGWDQHFEWRRKNGRVIKGHPGDEMRRLNR
jgi:hypothetical protein